MQSNRIRFLISESCKIFAGILLSESGKILEKMNTHDIVRSCDTIVRKILYVYDLMSVVLTWVSN
jgi:hypothetical protein